MGPSPLALGGVSLESEAGSRRVLVDDPTDATATLSEDCVGSFTVGGYGSPSDEITGFCERQGLSPTAINKRRHVQEVLEPGTSAYVLGQAVSRSAPSVWVSGSTPGPGTALPSRFSAASSAS